MRTKSLYVDLSTIPDSGKGLFARRAFTNGELICYFKGILLSSRQVNSKKFWGIRERYFIDLGKFTLDTYNSNSLGKYSNDAEGLTRTGKTNNAMIWSCTNGTMAYLAATRNISIGEEIFTDYGEEYWKALKSKG